MGTRYSGLVDFELCLFARLGGIKPPRPLRCTLFDPAIYLDFRKNALAPYRANEPIYLVHGTVFRFRSERVTRAATVCHIGKRNAGRQLDGYLCCFG